MRKSLSSKITYITMLISSIVISIVLVFVYYNIKYQIFVSIRKDILDNMKKKAMPSGYMFMKPRQDLYILKDGIIVYDPYNIGIIDDINIAENIPVVKKIDDREYMFIKVENIVVGKDITSISKYLSNIKIRFIIIFVIGITAITLLTYITTKKSMKHLNIFVKELSNLKGDNFSYRFIKPNTNDEVDELVEKFNELMGKIEKNYKLQEEFVSNVSHELKTPVANLIGYATMLKRWGYKDKEILEESVNSIISSAYKMKELIENMLLLSKNLELETEKIELRPFVEQIIGEKEKQYNQKFEISGNGTIIANKEALEIILSNLLNNAIFHGKPPYEVKLTENRIEIIDHGPGISKNDQEKIFERFYKSRNSKGHGLGLFLVKRLCNQMNLNISVESFNGYTKFEIRGDNNEK